MADQFRAIIYTRVSTSQQNGEDSTSLGGQYLACLKKAEAIDATVVGAYEEVKSGGLYLTRGELQKALADIEEGRANVLILSRLDRTGRELESLRDIRRRVEDAGGRLIFADGMQFEKSAVGNLLFTQLGAFAEFERELIRERMVAGLVAKAEAGIMPARALSPYGYHIVTRDNALTGRYPGCEATPHARDGQYVPVPDEACWMSPFFEQIAQGTSLRSCCALLTEWGAKTRSGKPWQPATLRNIVRNPVYMGRPAWRKSRRVVDERRAAKGLNIETEVARPREEWIELSAPVLVPERLWKAANAMMDRGRAERSGRTDRKYLLTGLVFCPRCGARCYSYAGGSTYIDPQGQRRRYRSHSYKCTGTTLRQTKAKRTCDLPTFGGRLLDELVIEAISHYLSEPDVLLRAQRDFEAQQAKARRGASDEAEQRRLRKQIAALEARERAAANAELDARIAGGDGASFAGIRRECERERQQATSALAAIEARLATPDIVLPPNVPPAVAETIEAALRGEMRPADKGLLLRRLVRRVYPVEVPEGLRESARQYRRRLKGLPPIEGEDGQRINGRVCGGVQLLLEAGVEDGPVLLLSRRLVEKRPAKDKKGRDTWELVYRNDLIIEAESSLPYQFKRASAVERDLLDGEQDSK